MLLHCTACATGSALPLVYTPGEGRWPLPVHTLDARPLPQWPVGTELCDAKGTALFKVTGRVLLAPAAHAAPAAPAHAVYAPLLTTLQDIPALSLECTPRRQGRALAWITLSDKGAAGQREDLSGPAIGDMVRGALPLCHEQGFLLPDEESALRALITELALGQGYDVICTTGGTGLGPRDVSPQATLRLLDIRLPGFEQAMMAASLAKTPHAAISRAVAGVVGKTICVNLPGSRKAVLENLAAVLPALPHALDKLHGDPADCGG